MSVAALPSSISDIRDAQVAAIKSALSSLKTVESHRGRFDSLQEIRRYGASAPAVLVSCSGWTKDPASGGESEYHIRWAWWVVTKDVPNTPRDVYSLMLCEALSDLIDENEWGLSNLAAPSRAEVKNAYATSIDKLGIGIWAISFTQKAVLPEISDTDYQAMNDFLKFHQDVDMAPADGQTDISETDELPQ